MKGMFKSKMGLREKELKLSQCNISLVHYNALLITLIGVPFDDLASDDEEIDVAYKHKYEGAVSVVRETSFDCCLDETGTYRLL
jgi:hypothetical protein